MALRIPVDGSTIELVQGDIVDQDVEALVNAANSALRRSGSPRRCSRSLWVRC